VPKSASFDVEGADTAASRFTNPASARRSDAGLEPSSPFRPQLRHILARMHARRVHFRDLTGSGFIRLLTKEASKPAQAVASRFDHLVGAARDRERNVQAEPPGGRFLAIEDAADIEADDAKLLFSEKEE